MNPVSSVTCDTTHVHGGVRCVVSIALDASPYSSGLELPLQPLFDVLNEQLRELFIFSQEEAEGCATSESYALSGCYDELSTAASLGRAIETACSVNTPLMVGESTQLYKPRFGGEHDSVHITLVRSHCCEDHFGDSWNVAGIEGKLTLVTESIFVGCGSLSLCRFKLGLALCGKEETVQQVASMIAQRLTSAYGI